MHCGLLAVRKAASSRQLRRPDIGLFRHFSRQIHKLRSLNLKTLIDQRFFRGTEDEVGKAKAEVEQKLEEAKDSIAGELKKAKEDIQRELQAVKQEIDEQP